MFYAKRSVGCRLCFDVCRHRSPHNRYTEVEVSSYRLVGGPEVGDSGTVHNVDKERSPTSTCSPTGAKQFTVPVALSRPRQLRSNRKDDLFNSEGLGTSVWCSSSQQQTYVHTVFFFLKRTLSTSHEGSRRTGLPRGQSCLAGHRHSPRPRPRYADPCPVK